MIRPLFLFMAALIIMFPGVSFAGPVGTYEVQGTNPEGGSSYAGTVGVELNGDTYTVIWNVGGAEYIGTGLGAAIVDGSYVMGPATGDDSIIAVSYISDGTFGQAFYVEQPDGQWKGIWAYGGGRKIGTETWLPH